MASFPESARFRRIGTITIFAVYFLILVGGIVRASGAGMGCPDWPTCFGQWIPPLDASQLPADYHEIYAERGYADTHFNPVKTWTEYINRLVGVTIGFLILLTLIYSAPFLKKDKAVFFLSLAAFLLVGFQGWLGSAVVASNLQPVMITAHMLVALLIVGLLIYAITRSQKERFTSIDASALGERFHAVLLIAMGMTLVQIAMGTQIREAVDTIAVALDHSDRHLWRTEFPLIFYVHRSFSSLILLINLWLAWKLIRNLKKDVILFKFAFLLATLVLLAVITGIILDRLGFPAFVQPVHLLLASLIFGVQFFIFIGYGYSRRGLSLYSKDQRVLS